MRCLVGGGVMIMMMMPCDACRLVVVVRISSGPLGSTATIGHTLSATRSRKFLWDSTT